MSSSADSKTAPGFLCFTVVNGLHVNSACRVYLETEFGRGKIITDSLNIVFTFDRMVLNCLGPESHLLAVLHIPRARSVHKL